MSLILAFATPHGVVMGGDRCITTTLTSGSSFVKTTTEQKVFLSELGYGFAYAGASTFKGLPASYWMKRLLKRYDRSPLDLAQYVLKLCIAFHDMESAKNIIIIGCGFENGSFSVLSSNSSSRKVVSHIGENRTCITYAGESDIAKSIIDIVPIDRSSYTIPDAIDFIKHVILTVSNIQRFGQTPVTVSPDCDILVATEDYTKWITKPPSLL